jgi:hypothetical protein
MIRAPIGGPAAADPDEAPIERFLTPGQTTALHRVGASAPGEHQPLACRLCSS